MKLIKLTTMTAGLSFVAVLLPTIAFALPPEMTDGFVCPVILTQNVTHSPKSGELSNGHYTIGGPDITVPVHATNGEGTGQPQGDHSQPGDSDYTAIWANQN